MGEKGENEIGIRVKFHNRPSKDRQHKQFVLWYREKFIVKKH